MRIKLFHCPASRSARVAFLINEIGEGIDTEVVSIDLYQGDQYAPDFTDRFPLHAVPAAEIETRDGQALTMAESGALIVALADAFPDRGLAPLPFPLTPARADYLAMIHMCGASFDMMLWQIRLHTHVLQKDMRDPRTAARYKSKIADEVVPMLAKRLENNEYICGDHFTAADCMIAHAVSWARTYNLCREFPFNRYLSRISKRPAFVKAYADAANFIPEPPEHARAKGMFTG